MKINHVIYSIFLLLVIGFQSLNAQEKINQLDANGNRTGVWEKYYTNNRIRYQGQFEAGKEIGIFNYYSALSSNHPIAIKTFIKNSDQATVQFFTIKGILESNGKMNGKNRVGQWVYFHPDGTSILSEENYKDGILNGESKTYYLTGKITEISHYKKGKLHGNLKRFSKNGILLDDLNYEKGKLHGTAKYYNIDGKLTDLGDYENDVKVGKWKYFEDGKSKDINKEK